MTFEGIICPVCSGSLNEEDFKGKIVCPHCSTNLRQKKYIKLNREYKELNLIMVKRDEYLALLSNKKEALNLI